MTTKMVKRVLRCPHKNYIHMALSLVNLTDREKSILVMADMRGLTEEHAAELLGLAIRTVQGAHRAAYRKLRAVWSADALRDVWQRFRANLA